MIRVKQPPNGTAFTREEALKIAESIGYPLLVRPSFVLAGRGMKIGLYKWRLEKYIDEAVKVSNEAPVLIDKFLR